MNDLWPTDLQVINTSIRTPVSILREQAQYLGKKTGNIVLGQVFRYEQLEDHVKELRPIGSAFKPLAESLNIPQLPKESPRYTRYGFLLHAPAINYTLRLFTISCPLELYPVEFKVHSSITLEPDVSSLIADDEITLLSILSKIFSDPFTLKAINSMYIQSVGDATYKS